MKASIIFFLNTSNKNRKTGKIPMYMQIVFKGKSESRLNADIEESLLPTWSPFTQRFFDRSSPINQFTNQYETKFHQFLLLHPTEFSKQSHKSILNYVLGINQRHTITVHSYIEDYYTKCVINNPQYSIGTKKNYRKAINHLEQFLSLRQTPNLLITELSKSVCFDFKNYLIGSMYCDNRAGMTEVSAAFIVKKIRTILIKLFWNYWFQPIFLNQ